MKALSTVVLVLLGVLFIAATPAFAATNWTGNVSTNWNTAGNWSPAKVPGSSTDVVIPGSRPRYPVITGNIFIKKLTINSGATVSTSGSPAIVAMGGVDIKAGGTLLLGSATLTSDGELSIAGTLNAGSGTISINGNFNNTGTFIAGTSTVIMSGNNRNITGNATTFYNLTIQRPADSDVDITVLGDLIVVSGRTLDMGNNTLTVVGEIGGGGTITVQAPYMTTATVPNTTQLDIKFSETVSLATAQNAANYAIDNGISVVSATRDGTDASLVHLSISTVAYGTEYTLTVNNVEDAQGHAIAPNSQKKFTPDSSTTYTITAVAGAGGTMSPSGLIHVTGGSNQGFTIAAVAGFHIDSVVVDGVNQGAITSYNFTNVNADHLIDAYFDINVWTIFSTAGPGGSVSPAGSINVPNNGDQTVTVTPDVGYHIDSVVVDGVDEGAVTQYDFTGVSEDHTLDAYFSLSVYSINASASAGGSISPSGASNVTHGGNQSYTVTPDTGYHIDSLVVDGVNLGELTGYDFTSVTANHSIDAYFSINIWYLNASASAGGSISPSGAVGVSNNANKTFTMTADPGYHLDSVVVDGVNQGELAQVVFTGITADHTINAYFSINIWSITATAGSGGSISPSGTVGVSHNGDQSFTVTPDAGHHIDSVVVDGVNQGVLSQVDFTGITANHTVDAYFSIDVFTVTATSGGNGTISPSGPTSVNYGGNQSYTVTADSGFHIDSVVVDGVNQGEISQYDFTSVAANHSIDAYFSVNIWYLNATASAGGTISPAGAVGVSNNANKSFTMTADPGYHLDSVVVDGANQGALTPVDFTGITADHTIAAYFSINVWSITAAAGAGGSVSPSGAVSVNNGADQSFTVTADPGYHLDSVLVDGVDQGILTQVDFFGVTANHSLDAYFSINSYSISASASAGGAISPPGQVSVDWGNGQSYAITPDPGYHVDSVLVDGVNQGALTQYDFTGVTANHSIDAFFSINIWTLTATASAGGSISPSGVVGVSNNADQSFSVTPDPGYHVDSVVVDGVNQGELSQVDFTGISADHTVAAYFSINVWTLTATASAGGSISPSGTMGVSNNSDQSFIVTPDAMHHVDSVVVDGVNQGPLTQVDFTGITANHTVDAYFSINVWSIAATAGPNGAISPSGAVSVVEGADQAFSVTPNGGFFISDVLVDSVSVGQVPSYTFTGVNANHTIEAEFSVIVWTITASASAGGSISPSGVVGVGDNDDKSFSVTPDFGYHVDSVLVDGVNQGALAQYDFTGITANHTIAAYFSQTFFPIVATAGPNGSISPSGTVSVGGGNDQSFTISAGVGYYISDVHVDSASVGPVPSYTFTNVGASHTIEAFFSIQKFAITTTATANGSVSPSGTTMVDYGAGLPVTITPDPGYYITDVFVDTVNVGTPSSYTFTNVTADHLLEAVFSTNARPTAVLLLSPTHQDTIEYVELGAVPFMWSSSTDANAGDLLSYTVSITGPGVNYSAGPFSDTSATLDLSLELTPDQEYQWSVSVSDGSLVTESGAFSFYVRSSPSAAGETGSMPKAFALKQNYPNPFNPTTTIQFELPERSEVTLRIYNILGSEVMEIAAGSTMAPGTYTMNVDMSSLSSGTYFCRMEAASETGRTFQQVRKMLLLK